ncbi:glycosyltransferase [Geminocystis sp. NIES-3709]|uniref:glycosyltransferase n=1 Tax=Geminocystis sp. NIES-3709 TaxID=1617448 RepID=UPI0005FC9C37|nr:glycosyltransferase [Geminocystis sp. NIES-3709]BAQ63561.1 glycosyl transferase [Geminocystis sp. NIES-3709]
MKISLIILFKNELEYAKVTLETVYGYLSERHIDFEQIAVDDSNDGTWDILQEFASLHPNNTIVVKGGEPSGYGKALQRGFGEANGDIIIPFNGDMCDSLDDVIRYIQLIKAGNDMVFGSRFMQGSTINGFSNFKTLISRLGNLFLQVLFRVDCNDLTNSFKAYRKDVLKEIQITSSGYSIGLEVALKAIQRKYKYTTIPISWSDRQYGQSKMSIVKSIISYLYVAYKQFFFPSIMAET